MLKIIHKWINHVIIYQVIIYHKNYKHRKLHKAVLTSKPPSYPSTIELIYVCRGCGSLVPNETEYKYICAKSAHNQGCEDCCNVYILVNVSLSCIRLELLWCQLLFLTCDILIFTNMWY